VDRPDDRGPTAGNTSPVKIASGRGRARGAEPRSFAVRSPGSPQVDLRQTGAGSRGELVGQIFLEYHVPRWEEVPDAPAGWFAKTMPMPEAAKAAAR
jgi:hypothetical protein